MRQGWFRFKTHRLLLAGICATIATALTPAPAAAAEARAYTGSIELPTYPWAAVKHPYFHGTDGLNIYPYPMLDFLSREKTNRTYRTVVLENDYLRITFLPELGGKIHEVIDKTTGKPMFYVNHVVKPGLIGQCGAWTSGGVEWNTGPQGHTVSCMQPIPVVILPRQADGSQSVAIGETERIYRTRWTVVVTLRPARSFIEERIRIYNPTETIRPYYFWNCTASPNTPGFRFIYPMTLGCDHAGEKFFHWPVDQGKDLTRGTTYQDASSIFAWHCDQDFFGSYNDDLGSGVVSYANHQELPGKKAWTWGQGSYGKMHQMDLTDHDGPYNEVQTGPLLTQAQVGRLNPCEAVEWKEWWYPIHGMGGFTFATRDLAANAIRNGPGQVTLRFLATGNWKRATVSLWDGAKLQRRHRNLSPRKPAEVTFQGLSGQSLHVEVQAAGQRLAAFSIPLKLPDREVPEKKQAAPKTASELVQAGWEDFLFARFAESEKRFRSALEQDSRNADAHCGLAFLKLDSDPETAATSAKAALAEAPENGMAAYALAIAEDRVGHDQAALDAAWKASLDPAVAVAARALVGKVLLRERKLSPAIEALSAPGPWRQDSLCRARLTAALYLHEQALRFGSHPAKNTNREWPDAEQLVEASLQMDPLDPLARNLDRQLHAWKSSSERARLAARLGAEAIAEDIDTEQPISPTDFSRTGSPEPNPLDLYVLAWSASKHSGGTGNAELTRTCLRQARAASSVEVFPYRREMVEVLRWALRQNPDDGHAALYLGHLLFHLGRTTEARQMWERAAELRADPVIACRALGMAARTLDGNLQSARKWLEKANAADPKDAIVARDLAQVLFALADQSSSNAERDRLLNLAREKLEGAFEEGKGRSDFVALLARSQNRLGHYAETARMLDNVRVTIWEGAHEAHDLYEQAHLSLGEAALKAGRPSEALKEFDRALEYPANLATGKLENAHEAHIQYQRGNALAALGRKADAVKAWKLAEEEPESNDSRINDARKAAKAALEKLGQ